MRQSSRSEIRLLVAQGHWMLGEHREALAALDRAVRADPASAPLREWVETIRSETEEGPIAQYLDALLSQLSAPLSAQIAEGVAAEGIPRGDVDTLPGSGAEPRARDVDGRESTGTAWEPAPEPGERDDEADSARKLEPEPSVALEAMEGIEADALEEAEPLDAVEGLAAEAEPVVEPAVLEGPDAVERSAPGADLLAADSPAAGPELGSEPDLVGPEDGAAGEEFEEQLSVVSTPTLAQLLLEQGHAEQARRVTEEFLRKNPADARGLALRQRLHTSAASSSRRVRTLERWLENAGRRRREREIRG